MSPTTLKIKTKMLRKGDSFEGFAKRWGFSRSLVTKVAHGERSTGPDARKVQKLFARYLREPVMELFPQANMSQKRAA